MLLDSSSAVATQLPKDNGQQHIPASPQVPLGMITPTATATSNSPISNPSHDWLASDGVVSRSESQSYRCLQKGVILLEEVENQTHNHFDPSSIDSALAYLKGALEACGSILACQNCAMCIEVSMLLTLVASKLSQLCEKIVSQLSQQSQRLQISSGRYLESGEGCSRVDAPPPRQNVFLGDYEINSMMEWVWSMKGLIMVQLKRLFNLAAQMKRKQPRLSGLQLNKLGDMERDVRKMVASLQGCEIKL